MRVEWRAPPRPILFPSAAPFPLCLPCVAAAARRVVPPVGSRASPPRYSLSDEPGFYYEKSDGGGFGIRIEADLVVEAADTRYAWGARPYLRFKYLSPIPMCRALVDFDLLSRDEIEWIDALHQRCREEISEELLKAAAVKGRGGAAGAAADASAAKEWLWAATEPLCGADAPTAKRVSGRKRAAV